MNLLDAARQALEALEDDPDAMIEVSECHWDYKRDLAITALRQAIEQVEQHKLVGWQWLDSPNYRKKLPADAIPEHWRPLYTAPPQRKPLTDEEIRAVYGDDLKYRDGDYMRFARAIERAHGIGGGE